MDYANLPLGLRVQTQIPLDVKEYSLSEADLSDLGVSSNLAFTYTKGLVVYCVAEGTRWEWREAVLAEVGLMPVNFTYPNNVATFGIDYSNKEYNFFPFFPAPIVPPFERVDQGNGLGIIIRGRDPLNYGSIGLDAFDVSTSEEPSTTFGATGDNSFASGDAVTAHGFASGVIGYLLNNDSQFGFANGVNSITSGYANAVFGMGHDVTSINTFIVGQAANIVLNSVLDINIFPEKQLFIIGNGTIQNNDFNYTVLTRSDAFIVRQSGEVTAPSLSIALIDAEATGRVLITREWFEGNSVGDFQSVTDIGFITTNYFYQEKDYGEGGAELGVINSAGLPLTGVKIIDRNDPSNPNYYSALGFNAENGYGTDVRISLRTKDSLAYGDKNLDFLFPNKPNPLYPQTDTYTIATIDDLNLQRVITYPGDFTGTTYVITNADKNHVLFIDNGATSVSIQIDSTITDFNFSVGFIQEGTGVVTFTTPDSFIRSDIGFKIKGQYSQAFVERKLNTSTYYVLGNLIA